MMIQKCANMKNKEFLENNMIDLKEYLKDKIKSLQYTHLSKNCELAKERLKVYEEILKVINEKDI